VNRLFIEQLRQDYASLYAIGDATGVAIDDTKGVVIDAHFEAHFDALIDMVNQYRKQRSKAFKTADLMGVDWVDATDTVGMMLYVDLFAQTFEGLTNRLSYFKDLGVNLVHLMPLLAPREGENDGGYAVRDYRQVNAKLGDLAEFEGMIQKGKSEGLKFCIDYVVNHTADDHKWAIAAREGDVRYRDYYHIFSDKDVVSAYEAHLPQVFPKVAPGNFTYLPSLNAHVMTTFYPYQWDLNFANPRVFHEVVENLLYFANLGIDMIRLDAIPYIWKALGTNSRNLPQVHTILRLFRALVGYVAPSCALLGEVIMSPHLIRPYFGTQAHPECHVLYHADNMVALWNSIATRDARHIEAVQNPQNDVQGAWMHYARCHDDIGWGLNEGHLRSLGFDPQMHKQFLIDFYYGTLPGSFSTGELYEYDPLSGDARNSGTLASLAGLEKALKDSDAYQVELAIKRIWLIHAILLLRPGIPMLYSGDEYGQLNSWNYTNDKVKSHDSRWLHRVPFNWDMVESADGLVHDVKRPFTWSFDRAAQQVYWGVRALIHLRRTLFSADALKKEMVIHQGNNALLVLAIDNDYILLFNLSEHPQWLYHSALKRHGFRGVFEEMLQGKSVNLEGEKCILAPLEINILRKSKKST